jgi:Domain of unknown function (DUF4389)
VSETTPAVPLDVPVRHPIQLVVTDDLRRNRLTVFFRLILVIPHLIWLTLWGIAAYLAVLVAWVVGIFMGRIPEGLHDFLAAYLRYATHVRAYVSLTADPFPAFTSEAGYPIDLEVAPAARQNRLTILFRVLLAIPALIVLSVLQLVAEVVSFLGWFYALFTGSMNRGMRDLLAYWLRYEAQTGGYLLLLTSRYPSFSDE